MRNTVYTKLSEAVAARRYMKVAQEMEERAQKRRSMLRTLLHDTATGTLAGGLGASALGAIGGAIIGHRANKAMTRMGRSGLSAKDYGRLVGRGALNGLVGGATLGGMAGASVGVGRGLVDKVMG